MLLQIHNALTTKDRLIKCKQDISPKCDQCNEIENVNHLFECRITKPAVNFIKKRISNYYQQNFNPTTQQIYLLDFPSNQSESGNILSSKYKSNCLEKKKESQFYDALYEFTQKIRKKYTTAPKF